MILSEKPMKKKGPEPQRFGENIKHTTCLCWDPQMEREKGAKNSLLENFPNLMKNYTSRSSLNFSWINMKDLCPETA